MIKVTTCKVGGGTTNIGGGSSSISPDWDVKWPDGDGKRYGVSRFGNLNET